MRDNMARKELQKMNCQEVNGSPAQIIEDELDLDEVLFGVTLPALDWAAKYEQLNGSVIESEGAPDSPGFKSPMAECRVDSHITQHNTTQHNTVM